MKNVKKIKISIIIPVYNEEHTITNVLVALEKAPIQNFVKEFIIVDDGSIDKTVENVKVWITKRNKFRLIQHKINKGKGAAVKTGISSARGDYILIQDADLEYNPLDISKLINPILSDAAKVTYGTRLKRLPDFNRDERNVAFLTHYFGNKLLSLVTSILYGQWITDMETGYKLFPKISTKNMSLKAKGFDFEPEITAKLMKSGYKILEIPITTNPRGSDEGKKLNALKDGPIAFWTLFKYRIFN